MSLVSDPPLYYRLHVFICTNRRPDDNRRGSCAGRGSEPLREYLKDATRAMGLKDLRINSAGCLDRCGLGPVMVIYPEGVWYTFHSIEDIDEILQTHIVKGGRVRRLMLDQGDQPVPTA